jgi:uncharacterized membrane protein YgdD (TMEM256/DUF423 family)
MSKLFLILGSINAATAVSMGAFGAHFLKTKISEDMLAYSKQQFNIIFIIRWV